MTALAPRLLPAPVDDDPDRVRAAAPDVVPEVVPDAALDEGADAAADTTADHPLPSPLVRQAALGALTASLLHDLASAMQGLSAALDELAAHRAGADPGFAAAVDDAKSAGDEAVQMFAWMRRFLRDGEVAPRPLRLDRIVERAVQAAGHPVRARAQLRVAALPGVQVLGCEPMLVHAVANLLRNAASASPPGGAIDLEARAAGDTVTLTVTDDGPGVPPAVAARMFEPFAAAHDAAGVGLAISAYALERMGGCLGYRRHPGRGAAFHLTLPRADLPGSPGRP